MPQKRASAVQSTFKLVTDAHTKAIKALRDYAEHDTTVDVVRLDKPLAVLQES